jgi:hypothetical protein
MMRTRRTVGYDFNWHVPKGVTPGVCRGRDDTRIEGLPSNAPSVKRWLKWNSEAKTRVRVGGQTGRPNHRQSCHGVSFCTHVSTRPNDKGEVDPHLHIHAFVFNATYDSKEQKFKAAQFRDLKRDANYFRSTVARDGWQRPFARGPRIFDRT